MKRFFYFSGSPLPILPQLWALPPWIFLMGVLSKAGPPSQLRLLSDSCPPWHSEVHRGGFIKQTMTTNMHPNYYANHSFSTRLAVLDASTTKHCWDTEERKGGLKPLAEIAFSLRIVSQQCWGVPPSHPCVIISLWTLCGGWCFLILSVGLNRPFVVRSSSPCLVSDESLALLRPSPSLLRLVRVLPGFRHSFPCPSPYPDHDLIMAVSSCLGTVKCIVATLIGPQFRVPAA